MFKKWKILMIQILLHFIFYQTQSVTWIDNFDQLASFNGIGTSIYLGDSPTAKPDHRQRVSTVGLLDNTSSLKWIGSDNTLYQAFYKFGVKQAYSLNQVYTDQVYFIDTCSNEDKQSSLIIFLSSNRYNVYAVILQNDGTLGTKQLIHNHSQLMHFTRCVNIGQDKYVLSLQHNDGSNLQMYQFFTTVSGTTFTVGTKTKINTFTSNIQNQQKMAWLQGSNQEKYVAAWQGKESVGLYNVYYRTFSTADGSPIDTTQKIVKNYTGADGVGQTVDCTSLENGGFVVTLNTGTNSSTYGNHVGFIVVFNADFSKGCGGEIFGNTYSDFLKSIQAGQYLHLFYINLIFKATDNIYRLYYYTIDLDSPTCEKTTAVAVTSSSSYYTHISVSMIRGSSLNLLLAYVNNNQVQFYERYVGQGSICSTRSCAICDGDMVNSCRLCAGSTEELRKIRKNDTSGLCTCDDGYYDDGATIDCQPCLYKCTTCDNGNTCLTCTANRDISDNLCFCNETYYEDGNQDCVSCSSDCYNCIDLDTKCTDCVIGKYLDSNTCLLCNNICESCLNDSSCITCNSSNVNRETTGPRCICLQGFYDQSDPVNQWSDQTCSSCEDFCISCTIPVECIECKPGIQGRTTNVPYCYCQFDFYEDNSQNCVPIILNSGVQQICKMTQLNLIFQQWQTYSSGTNIYDNTSVYSQQAIDFSTGQYNEFLKTNFGNTDLTFSFWMKINTYPSSGNFQDIIVFSDSSNDNQFLVSLIYYDLTNTKLQVKYSEGINTNIQYILLNSSDNNWVKYVIHYTLTGQIRFFIKLNGEVNLIKYRPIIDPSSTDNTLVFKLLERENSKFGSINGSTFDGSFDDFRIYNRILTNQEQNCLSNTCDFMCETCENENNYCTQCIQDTLRPHLSRVDPPVCDCPPGYNANGFNPVCSKTRQKCLNIPENDLALTILEYNLENGLQSGQIGKVSEDAYLFDDTNSAGQKLKSQQKYELPSTFTISFWMKYIGYSTSAEQSNPGEAKQSMGIFTAYQTYVNGQSQDFTIRVDDFTSPLVNKENIGIGCGYSGFIANTGQADYKQYLVDGIVKKNEWQHYVFVIDNYDWLLYFNGQLIRQWKSPVTIQKNSLHPTNTFDYIWGGLTSTEKWSQNGDSQGLRFNGYIDENIMYYRVLSQSEILCLGDKCNQFSIQCWNEAKIDSTRQQCLTTQDENLIDLQLQAQDYTKKDGKSPVSDSSYIIFNFDEYLKGVDNNSKISLGGNFSISFWYKIEYPKSIINQVFFYAKNQGDTILIQRQQDQRLIQVQITRSSGSINTQKIFCFDCIKYYTWQHIAFIFETENWSIYLDGEQQVYNQVNMEIPVVEYDQKSILVGYSLEYQNTKNIEDQIALKYTPGFGGLIDEFKLYSKPLKNQEIRCLYDTCNQITCGGGLPATCNIEYGLCENCAENRENEYCNCPIVTYDQEPNYSLCPNCFWGCFKCKDAVSCDQCVESNPPRIEGSCECPIGYFSQNPNPSIIDKTPYYNCIQCSYKCISCDKFNECIECKTGIGRLEAPICRCKDEYYDDLENSDCRSCRSDINKYCRDCVKTTSQGLFCLECEGQLKYDQQKNICQCQPGTYTLEVDSLKCNDCINNAKCLGGMEIQINAGFWRQNTTTDYIEPCINMPDNCLGGSQQFTCIEGSIGALCESCDIEGKYWGESYGNSKDYQCIKCKDQTSIFKTVATIGFILFLGMSMLDSSHQLVEQNLLNECLQKMIKGFIPVNDEYSIYVKILTHYFYVIQVITTFNLQIPGAFNEAGQATGNPVKNLGYSFDCFLYSVQYEIPFEYFRIIWQFLVFIVLVFICFTILSIKKIITRKDTVIKDGEQELNLKQIKKGGLRIIQILGSSIICMFIFFQPSFVQLLADSVACKTISGKDYLVRNTSIECYTSEYNFFSFAFILPMLVVWVFIIPIMFIYFIRKAKYTHRTQKYKINQKNNIKSKQIHNQKENNNFYNGNNDNFETDRELQIMENQLNIDITDRKNQYKKCPYYYKEDDSKENRLQNPIFKFMFGFLYVEYSQDAYFWELVKVIQKMIIVICLAFYSIEIKIKAVLIFLTLFIYGVLLVKYNPYRKKMHNYIDIASTNVCAVSVILGIFIHENKYQSWTYFGYIFLSIINLAFICVVLYLLIGSAYLFKKDSIEKAGRKNKKIQKYLEDRDSKQFRAKNHWKILKNRVNLFVLTKKYQNKEFSTIEQRLQLLNKELKNTQIEEILYKLQKEQKNEELELWIQFKQDVLNRLQELGQGGLKKKIKSVNTKKQVPINNFPILKQQSNVSLQPQNNLVEKKDQNQIYSRQSTKKQSLNAYPQLRNINSESEKYDQNNDLLQLDDEQNSSNSQRTNNSQKQIVRKQNSKLNKNENIFLSQNSSDSSTGKQIRQEDQGKQNQKKQSIRRKRSTKKTQMQREKFFSNK